VLATGLVSLVDSCIWKNTELGVAESKSLTPRERDGAGEGSSQAINPILADAALPFTTAPWLSAAWAAGLDGPEEDFLGHLPEVDLWHEHGSGYPPPLFRRTNETDGQSTAGSVISQTLEEYPSLTSYALNRVFVHARKGYILGADPKNFLQKLVIQGGWSR